MAKTTTAKAKPAAAKKTAKPKAEAAAKASSNLDRKTLSQKARQLKTELLAIRFNLQSPSLKDYRKKRKELQTILASLS